MSEIVKGDGFVTLIPASDIVSVKVVELKDEIDHIIDDYDKIVLDFKSVTIIDSSGIGVLISTQNRLKKKNGELKVINVSDDIHSMFKIMRLDKHFEIETA